MLTIPIVPSQESFSFQMLALAGAIGWHYLSPLSCLKKRGSPREVLLKSTLIAVLQTRRFEYKGETYSLSAGAIDQIVRELTAVSWHQNLLAANKTVYEKLLSGVTVTELMPDGHKHYPNIALIDWVNPKANRFEVSDAFELSRPDDLQKERISIVAFINGIPLVVIETSAVEKNAALSTTLGGGIHGRLLHQMLNGAPLLSMYTQLLLVLVSGKGVYAPTCVSSVFWSGWREEEFDENYFLKIKNTPVNTETQPELIQEKPVVFRLYCQQRGTGFLAVDRSERLLISLLEPMRLLELLRIFILFKDEKSKLLARSQQFFAVRALLKQMKARRTEGGREGGIISHAAGSGQSVLMLFLIRAIFTDSNLKNCKILVLSERLILEETIAKIFLHNDPAGQQELARYTADKTKVVSIRALARQIGSGSTVILCADFQGLESACALPECFNPSHNLVVLFDGETLLENKAAYTVIQKALPRAAYMVFAGQPLLQNISQADYFSKKTRSHVLAVAHEYSFQRAIEDNFLVPLLYEERLLPAKITEASARKWLERSLVSLSKEHQSDLRRQIEMSDCLKSENARIALIAWDIAIHFHENFKALYPPLLSTASVPRVKGLLIVSSRQDALLYKARLDQTGLVNGVLLPQVSGRHEEVASDKESDFLNRQAGQNFLTIEQASMGEQEIIKAFLPPKTPDLLIFIESFLVDSGAPANTILYLDNPLPANRILPVLAQVNSYEDEKQYGILLDYRGILKQFAMLLKITDKNKTRVSAEDKTFIAPDFLQTVREEYQHLPKRHQRLIHIFSTLDNPFDREQCRQRLLPRYESIARHSDLHQPVREDFYQAYAQFNFCLQLALSSHTYFEEKDFSIEHLQIYRRDRDFFNNLYEKAAEDAATLKEDLVYPLRDNAHASSFFSDDYLIEATDFKVQESRNSYQVSSLNVENSQIWSAEKISNETTLLQTRLHRMINQGLEDDPYAQQFFGREFSKINEEVNAYINADSAPVSAQSLRSCQLWRYQLFKQFNEQLAQRLIPGMPATFVQQPSASAYFGVLCLLQGIENLETMPVTEKEKCTQQALWIDKTVQRATFEHSLNLRHLENALYTALLPSLFVFLGLEKSRVAIEKILKIAHWRVHHHAK